VLVLKHVVDEVKLYTNAAIVSRSFEVDLKSGVSEVIVDNLEPVVDPDSIRIKCSGGVKVVDVEYRVYEKRLEDVLRDEVLKLRSKIKEVEKEKLKCESEVDGVKSLIDAIDKSYLTSLSFRYLRERKLDLDDLLEIRSKYVDRLTLLTMRIRELEAELASLKSKLDEISKGETVKVGALKIITEADQDGKYLFLLSYNVGNAFWRPTYDLVVEGSKLTVKMYARVVQDTGCVWDNVSLAISNRRIARVRKPEPRPWFIRPIETKKLYSFKAAPRAAAPRVEAAEAELKAIKVKEAFEEAIEVPGVYLTYHIPGKVTVEPGRPKVLLLDRLQFDCETKYVWDAFRETSFIEVVTFKNGDTALEPGECRIFDGETYIGRTRLNRILPKQEVEVAVKVADGIECKRDLIKHEEIKGGILKNKALIARGYRLEIINHYDKEIKVEVYDRIPVSKHPEVKVELTKCEPRYSDLTTGILKWEFSLKPDEKRVIEFEFKVEHPLDLHISI